MLFLRNLIIFMICLSVCFNKLTDDKKNKSINNFDEELDIKIDPEEMAKNFYSKVLTKKIKE